MRRVAELVAEAAGEIAAAEARPTYVAAAPPPMGGGGDRPYFGSVPDFAQTGEGYALSGVAQGGPAEKAGLQAGDVIVQLGDSRIGNLEDFDSALRKFKAGDVVKVTVRRGDEELSFDVTLEPPR
jgi:S1-C subfamily serine protease